MKENLDKVIVAIDYEDPQKAFRLVDELGDLVSWYKVGPVLFTLSGVEVVNFLHKRGKKIFLDLKLHDTPNVVQETVKQLGGLGVQFATVHCTGGRRMLEAASMGCRGSQLKLLGVTLLTSQEGSAEAVLRHLDVALQSRLAGILCSSHEVRQVKERILPGFLCVSAGIRLPKEEVFQDDQVRVASPREALDAGADYLIIGRPITQAREPRDVVERLFQA